MPHEQLENLVKVGQLKAQPACVEEVNCLINSGLSRLNDANNASLSLESRFDLAYNAAHAFSRAALRRLGYRSESRYLVFQSLKHTLDLPNAEWRVLDNAHRKRNLAEYEGRLEIDDALFNALLRVAGKIARLLAEAD